MPRLLELLLDTSLRAIVLAGLAAIVLATVRVRNANFQHRVWAAVLWAMLLLPVLAQLTPALSLLPSGWRWRPEVVAQEQPVKTAGEPLPGRARSRFALLRADSHYPADATGKVPRPTIVPDVVAALPRAD